jgi:uncharacterized protein (DUF1697 family)
MPADGGEPLTALGLPASALTRAVQALARVAEVATHAAFLRGMNLGKRRIANAELCEAFSELGFADVRAFRASGNVVFSTAVAAEAELTGHIETGLAAALGYEVPTFLRTAAEVRGVAAHEPFDAELVSASAGKLQAMMLLDAPGAAARREVLALAGERDLLAFGERELYWLPSGGVLDSELDLKAVAALLGATTQRTMGTIELMAAKHFPV